MNKMRQSVLIDRRRFFGSIAGLDGQLDCLDNSDICLADIPSDEPEFVIINGWVLTREDVAAREVTPDVV